MSSVTNEQKLHLESVSVNLEIISLVGYNLCKILKCNSLILLFIQQLNGIIHVFFQLIFGNCEFHLASLFGWVCFVFWIDSLIFLLLHFLLRKLIPLITRSVLIVGFSAIWWPFIDEEDLLGNIGRLLYILCIELEIEISA